MCLYIVHHLYSEDKVKEATKETFTNTKLENGVNHSSDDNYSDSSENHKSPGLSGFQKTQTMREMLAGIPGISMKVHEVHTTVSKILKV